MDYLILSSGANSYGKFLSSSYYFPFNLGLEFGLVTNIPESPRSEDLFELKVKEKYIDDYFVEIRSAIPYDDGRSENGLSVFIGLSYKMEANKWLFIPGIQYGHTSLQVRDAEVFLKERGTNQIESETYEPRDGDNGFSSLVPRAFVGYRVFGSVLFGLEARFNQYDCDLKYEITRENLYSGETSTQIVNYSQTIRSFHLGLEVKLDNIRLVDNM